MFSIFEVSRTISLVGCIVSLEFIVSLAGYQRFLSIAKIVVTLVFGEDPRKLTHTKNAGTSSNRHLAFNQN